MDEQALSEALRSRAAEQQFDPAAVGRAVERGRAHRRRRRATMVTAVPVVALAVAGGAVAALRSVPSDDAPVADGSGADATAPPVQLLTQPPPEGVAIHMQARLDGTLTVTENGCLALTVPDLPAVPVAWPHGWTVDRRRTGARCCTTTPASPGPARATPSASAAVSWTTMRHWRPSTPPNRAPSARPATSTPAARWTPNLSR
jgi:hypothetical protein